MEIITNPILLNKSTQELYTFLLDFNNHKKLMPKNLETFKVYEKGFEFSLKGMPIIKLELTEKIPQQKIVFESPKGKINFSLWYEISKIENQTKIQIFFKGKFNAMIKMMVNKPLNSLINTISEKLSVIYKK